MNAKNTMIVHPSNEEQLTVIKAFLDALKIKFELTKEGTYHPELLKKVLKGKKDIQQRKGITNTIEELKELCK